MCLFRISSNASSVVAIAEKFDMVADLQSDHESLTPKARSLESYIIHDST